MINTITIQDIIFTIIHNGDLYNITAIYNGEKYFIEDFSINHKIKDLYTLIHYVYDAIIINIKTNEILLKIPIPFIDEELNIILKKENAGENADLLNNKMRILEPHNMNYILENFNTELRDLIKINNIIFNYNKENNTKYYAVIYFKDLYDDTHRFQINAINSCCGRMCIKCTRIDNADDNKDLSRFNTLIFINFRELKWLNFNIADPNSNMTYSTNTRYNMRKVIREMENIFDKSFTALSIKQDEKPIDTKGFVLGNKLI